MSKARDLANGATALSAVSPTELGYLDGVTSAVQTQINSKQSVVSGVSDSEIGYLDGVTSAIQTQLNAKAVYPTQTGNSGKYLTTDGTNPSWGSVSAGKVLQVVSFSTSTASTVTGTTFTDTNITASITPSSSTSKILILLTASCQMYSSGSVNQIGMGLQIKRGATTIWQGNSEDWYITNGYTGYHQLASIQTINYLDSPESTSSNTYTLQIKASASSGTAKTSDNSRPSSLILMEIAG